MGWDGYTEQLILFLNIKTMNLQKEKCVMVTISMKPSLKEKLKKTCKEKKVAQSFLIQRLIEEYLSSLQ